MTIFMPHWPKPIGNRPISFIDLGLDRVIELSKRLDNPHAKIPNLIHVAGTNGKASTIFFIRKILEESGYTVNMYISPHLVYFNERIVLAGKEITDKFLYDILEECRAVSDGIKITFFEGVTIAAFLAFSKVKADFTLIETGMGGRLDATNIINPIISIITSLSLDHTEYLGETLKDIAYEKAGIIKQNCVAIISQQKQDALKIIEENAVKSQASIYRFGHEWECKKDNDKMLFLSDGEPVSYPRPSLIGDHQILNSGNAIACATVLHHKFGYTNITHETISSALTSTHCPARLELIRVKNYFTNLCNIFLDGAHNVGGAEVISNWLNEKKICIILGMTRGKDTIGFLELLKHNIKMLCAVCVKSEPRSQTAAEIVKSALSIGIECTEYESIDSALNNIIKIMQPDPKNKLDVLVCGSLFLAKDLYDVFNMS